MKRKILFVDDDRAILDSFRTMLHSMRREWKCRFAESGAEGLELMEKQTFDVVIADMRMPGIDGADFLKEVAARQPGAVRMILSGYSEMQLLLKSVKHAHQFLSKPCSSETVIETIRRVIGLSHILQDEAVREIVAGLDALPAIPDLYIQITHELENNEPDLRQVARLVERDIGVTTTLMKVVNSSFFGFFEKVSSPARAVTLLGIEALKGLVLSAHLLKEIDESSLAGYSMEKLWAHSLQTGYFAKAIAAMENDDRTFIEDCFIGGVLHDVGKLVLLTSNNSCYLPILESARSEGGPVVALERRELGVSHAEVGAYLLGLWGFKPSVVEGVYAHHTLDRCGEACTPAMIIHAANALQHEMAANPSGYEFSTLNMDWFTEAGLHERPDQWREECQQHMEQA